MSVQNVAPPPPRLVPPPPGLPGPLVPNGTPNRNLSGPRRKRFLNMNTLLGRFQGLAAVIILLAIIALVVSYFMLNETEKNFRTIVTKITPSIDAAQQLSQALNEMDARAADYQLTSRIDVTSPDLNPAVYGAEGIRNTSWRELEDRRRQVDNALSLARIKASYPGEAEAINVISNRFYDYFARISQMRYELDLGRKEAALANYKAAQDILVGNLGNVELDARGSSKEKALKDNNWKDVQFTCQFNCTPASLNKTVTVSFDSAPGSPYLGIAPNAHKLLAINNQQLGRLGTISPVSNIMVIVSASLVVAMIVVVAIYYAAITHRVVNLGFGLAFVAGVALAMVLIATLNTANQDYNQFSSQFIRMISNTSEVQQLSADASADISRLLLSPESPGLDSTSPALTTDVKRAFTREALITAYENKRKQIEQKLGEMWQQANTGLEIGEMCKIIATSGGRCSGNNYAWTRYTDETKNILDRFDKKLLAEAIAINITPKANPEQKVTSAREPYNQFSASVKRISDQNKADFDNRACEAIGTGEFGNGCNGATGYLNQLQILIWVMFPLLSLLVSFGVWFASRMF